MATVIIDPAELRRLIRERRECGGDRYDEVWDGVYVMSPLADNQHQQLATKFAGAIDQAMGDREEVQVFAGTNVSDRDQRWKRNFRCPDVAVFLPGNPAQDRGSHWFGGPISPSRSSVLTIVLARSSPSTRRLTSANCCWLPAGPGAWSSTGCVMGSMSWSASPMRSNPPSWPARSCH
jgi:hypothetical protein